MKYLSVILLLLVAAPAQASEIENDQDVVLDCVSRIDGGTTWDQCRRLMFLPCEKHEVGSEPHLACLSTERTAWKDYMESYREQLDEKLTAGGSAMLSDLIGQWVGYVSQHCGEVARSKEDISADAARSGCEIAETVGITAEFFACLDGRSTSPYCTIQE